MSGIWIALLGFSAMLALIALRLHVGAAMFVTGCFGYAYLSSAPALFAFLKTNAYNVFASYTLSVIPLFILMGALAEQSGLSSALFRAAAAFMGPIRGGLAMATVMSSAAFGAASGSTIVNAAVFTRMAMPEMTRFGYDVRLSSGCIAGRCQGGETHEFMGRKGSRIREHRRRSSQRCCRRGCSFDNG